MEIRIGSTLSVITTSVTASAVLLAALLGPGHARADEIRLLSAASMQTVFKEVIGDFERTSGHKVVIHYSTMGAIAGRIAGGEEADLVISSPASIANLVAQGRIDPGSKVSISRTGVGIVVPSGNPTPRIASIEDFSRALLEANVIVYADPVGGGAGGIHVARLIERLGLSEKLKPKVKFGAGGDVAEVTLAQGDGALGLTQVSEIVGKVGAEFVPLPEELQNYTGFTAGTPAGARKSEAVTTFIRYLKSPAAVAVMNAKGMQVD